MSKKLRLTLTLLLFSFLIVFFILGPKSTTNLVIQPTPNEEITLPSIQEGEEIEYQGYKYSKHSDIVVSIQPEIHCSIKPDNLDDGWKTCEAIFEIENLATNKPILTSPQVNLDFQDKQNVRNIQVTFSSAFDVEDKTHSTQKEVILGKTELKTIPSQPQGSFGTAEVTTTLKDLKLIKPEKTNMRKRKFKNFKPISTTIGETISQPMPQQQVQNSQSIQDIPADTNNTNISIQNVPNLETTNTTEINITNTTTQESTENTTTINTTPTLMSLPQIILLNSFNSFLRFLNPFKNACSNSLDSVLCTTNLIIGGSSKKIDTSKPFAVKATFEIPKYAKNQFNFEIQESTFDAYIDPGVSACGTLNTENGIYTLDQDVSASKSCFIIEGNNITLDCQNHLINFSTSLNSGIGIDTSNFNSTTIKNCILVDGISSTTSGYGIQLSNSNENLIQNNKITILGNSGMGIFSLSSNLNTLSSNTISIEGGPSYGSYLLSSGTNTLNNNIISTYQSDSYGLILDTSSNSNSLSNNSITTSGAGSYGIFILSNSNSNSLSNTQITTSGSSGHGIYLFSTTQKNSIVNSSILTNNTGYALYLVNTNHDITLLNTILNASNSGTSDFLIANAVTGGEWNFTNTTFQDMTWQSSASGTLNIFWYLDIYTNYTDNSIASNTTISITDANETSQTSTQTNSEGKARQALLEYSKTNSGGFITTYYSNYTINATSQTEETLSQSINLSTNREISFTFQLPVISLVSPANETTQTSSNIINFTYNITEITPNNCSLIINNTVNQTNNSISLNNLQTFTQTLANGDYTWKIRCNTQNVESNSETRSLTLNIPSLSPATESSTASSKSSGSGGGGTICQLDLKCGKWSRCKRDNSQKRTCVNKNTACSTKKIIQTQGCGSRTNEGIISEKVVLFDINLEILKSQIAPGKTLQGSIGLINVGIPGQVSAQLKYSITNQKGTLVYEESETVPIETQIEIIKEIDTSELPEGEYTLTVDLTYEGQTEPAQTQSNFVITKSASGSSIKIIGIIILIILIIIAIIYLIKKYKSKIPSFPKTSSKDIKPSITSKDIKPSPKTSVKKPNSTLAKTSKNAKNISKTPTKTPNPSIIKNTPLRLLKSTKTKQEKTQNKDSKNQSTP